MGRKIIRIISISTNHSIDLQKNEEFHLQNPDLNRNVVRVDTAERIDDSGNSSNQVRVRPRWSTRFIDPSPFQIQIKE